MLRRRTGWLMAAAAACVPMASGCRSPKAPGGAALTPPVASCPVGMASVPGGSFKRCTPDVDERTVRVPVEPFCIDRTEVTVDAYASCVREGRCTGDHPASVTPDGKTFTPDEHCNFGVPGRGSHPMNCVDWSQSVSYCAAQNKRLPTEQEWEWAARGGAEARRYPWGNEPRDSHVCGLGTPEKTGTCPVGSIPSEDAPGGIHDLAWNVEEWTATRYETMMPNHGQATNILNTITPDCGGGASDCRIVRGGSWDHGVGRMPRVGEYNAYPTVVRLISSGFRCASADITSCTRGMAAVPGGSLERCTPEVDEPQENAKVRDFCLDTTPVTVDEYAACVRAGQCTEDHDAKLVKRGGTVTSNEYCNYGAPGKGNHPMNCVDWSQSARYCEVQHKRLPTELEHEWAARGGAQGRVYPWGDAAPAHQLCWSTIAGTGETCRVGSFPSGDAPGGIHDLTGNVEEWTSTRFNDLFPDTGMQKCGGVGNIDCRITRGTSSNDLDGESFRVSVFGVSPVTDRLWILGFRCAR